MHLRVLAGLALSLPQHLDSKPHVTVLVSSNAQRKICLRVLGVELQYLLKHAERDSNASGMLMGERFFDEKRDVRTHSTTFRFPGVTTL